MSKKLQLDWILFAAVAALSLFGVVMVYSSSAMLSIKETGGENQFVYAIKQFGSTVLGLFLMLVATRFDYRWLRQSWFIIAALILTVVLLCAVFGFPAINGARRWIKFGAISFQPSEMAKITLPLFLAYFFAKREGEMADWKRTLIPIALVTLSLLGLIFVQPDLGTTIVLAAIFGVTYFAAGADWRHFAVTGSAFLVAVLAALVLVPWRMKRLLAFLDPWSDPENSGYQVIQSLLAVGSGGIWGVGFAQGQQKIHYLPYAHSDFIFAIICEELGLVGALIILTGFGIILWRGSRAALHAPDRFGKLLGMGLVTGVVVQAFFNMSVVIGILPTKGIPLPLISYGGSSIVVTLLAMGVLLNISQYAGTIEVESATADEGRRKRASLRAREA
jgi:cell division protein FtsW